MFSEIAACLSFTEAAKVLGISKGYLSAQLKQLEQELKTPLLVRTTRSVRLTRAGEQLFNDFKNIRHSLVDIERNLASEQQNIEGMIRITAPRQFSESLLMDCCFNFQSQYPQVTFFVDSSYTLYDLSENDFDLAIRATENPPDNMIANKLHSYDYAIVAASQYLKQHGTPQSIDELNQHHCLVSEHQTCWQFSDHSEVDLVSHIAINDNFILRAMALKGQGIAKFPRYFVHSLIEQGELIELFADKAKQGQSIYILQPQLLYPSARVDAFVKYLRSELVG